MQKSWFRYQFFLNFKLKKMWSINFNEPKIKNQSISFYVILKWWWSSFYRTISILGLINYFASFHSIQQVHYDDGDHYEPEITKFIMISHNFEISAKNSDLMECHFLVLCKPFDNEHNFWLKQLKEFVNLKIFGNFCWGIELCNLFEGLLLEWF